MKYLLLLLLFVPFLPSKTQAWTTCGVPQATMPLSVSLNHNGAWNANVSYQQMSDALDRALATWTNLPDSNISFVRVPDNQWSNLWIDFRPNLLDPLPVKAETYCNRYGPGVQLEMHVRSSYTNYDTNPFDGITPGTKSLDYLLTHEVGHFLGLGHSTCEGLPQPIMCSGIGPNGEEISLGISPPIDPDAQAAMAAFYPQAGAPTSTPTPVPSPTPTPVVNTYACLVNSTPVWSQTTPGRVCP